ncbi:exosortase family protein XrtF [Kordia periserrulae]|uniref:Exosortase family protein XrtF n=1 Tax=Kordia periserrulae TaxID=701523 RepID=A0A2T6BQZ9_9FLAO|nr:exosortase family protein XrtF [Kordia periserrulae]PTX58521.1 exosortase family protein XrtF [Kordia periserrulae]
MFKSIQKYKSALGFIVKFFVVYAMLTYVYSLYLSNFDGEPDGVTRIVAQQTESIINTLGYEASVEVHDAEPTMKLLVHGNYVGRIVEGCNSVSVLILFITFVIAFTGNLKNTVVFLLVGSVLVYLANLIRIVILGIGLYSFPEQEYLLHQIVFPTIIYGMVFLLWMLWVQKFSKK